MKRSLRQTVAGVLALPLSLLPFLAYATLTPEGRLLAGRVGVLLAPPRLGHLSTTEALLARAVAPRYRNGVMVLAYHGIGSGDDGGGRFVISPERFGEHLAALQAAGMHTVTARQVAAAFTSGRNLPPNAVMISFDDGRADALRYADPLLKQAHMRATMFVITSEASSPGLYYASWGRLEAASRSGRWDLESHTDGLHHEEKVSGGRSLPALTSLAPDETLAAYRTRVREDLARATAALTAHTGRRPVAFAYPFGAYGADRTNSPAIRGVLRQEVTRQYTLAFHQQDQASVPLATATQPRAGLRRLEVGNWTGLQLLARLRRAAAVPDPSSPGPAAAPTTTTLVGPVAPDPTALSGAAPALTGPAGTSWLEDTNSPSGPGARSAAPAAPAAPPGTTHNRTYSWPSSPSPDRPDSTPTTTHTTTKPGRSPSPSPSPRPTSPPPTTSPTTSPPPTNCGGQAHGHPCNH